MSMNQPIRVMTAAVERARLTVVPARSLARSQAARTPFAVLVIALLVAGVVGLLMFNTHMQQTSFTATALEQQSQILYRNLSPLVTFDPTSTGQYVRF